MSPRRFGAALLLLGLIVACTPFRQEDPVSFLDLATGRTAGMSDVISRFAASDVVFMGESHDDPAHHAAQLSVIRSIKEQGGRVAVGLEMFQRRDQPVLDAWVAGNLDEAAMREAFARNWSLDWDLYRDIFLYCRERRIPMIGLNVPREITAQVAREGAASLSPEQAKELPPVACVVDPVYASFLRRVHGAHGGAHKAGPESFRRFCEAQVLWDAAMAYYAADFLARNPGSVLVVLTGAVHAWKPAMPARIRSGNAGLRLTVVLPKEPGTEGAGVDDADYLLLSPG